MNRRGFLKGILAAGVAPYVVTGAGVLMPVKKLWTPINYNSAQRIIFNGLVGALVPGDFVLVDVEGLQRVARVERVVEHKLGASVTLYSGLDGETWFSKGGNNELDHSDLRGRQLWHAGLTS